MPLPAPTHPFPTYLLSSLSFRRRRSSSAASTSTLATSPSTASTSPQSPPPFLSGSTSHLRCAKCLADLCLTDQIISKGFTGRHGRAYLVGPSGETSSSSSFPSASPFWSQASLRRRSSGTTSVSDWAARGNLPNTNVHKPVPRQLVTGAHTVADISCTLCGTVLGWKYVAAEEENQRYKVGKFILETKRVVRGVNWENEEATSGVADRRRSTFTVGEGLEEVVEEGREGDREVEFDSADEDECEDLFAGVWDPELARRRRASRGGSVWRKE